MGSRRNQRQRSGSGKTPNPNAPKKAKGENESPKDKQKIQEIVKKANSIKQQYQQALAAHTSIEHSIKHDPAYDWVGEVVKASFLTGGTDIDEYSVRRCAYLVCDPRVLLLPRPRVEGDFHELAFEVLPDGGAVAIDGVQLGSRIAIPGWQPQVTTA